jgi:hypothetical protein
MSEDTNSNPDPGDDDLDATHRTEDPATGGGSDVGGPAGSIQSTTQDALTGHRTAGDVDDDDAVSDQAETGGV